MKNQRLDLIKCAIAVVFILLGPQANASGTVVGNGGDPIFEFLRAARESMNATMKFVLNEPEERSKFCESTRLNAEQISYCQNFFMEVAPQILRLSLGQKATEFVLREEPLYVKGPDGKAMTVAARTMLGPDGVIEFHRDSVRTMAPVQVLFLIAHEFEHKALLNGKPVSDNEAIGPFSSGRELLDAVASGLVSVAKRKGKIGSQFGIRDLFECEASNGNAQFGAQILGARLFQKEDLMSYETSIGNNPMDGSIYFQEDFKSVLRLKLVIAEPNNCGEATPDRKSTMQIIRSVDVGSGQRDESVVAEMVVYDNPVCNKKARLSISFNQIRFSCKYFASEGTTSSPFSVNLMRK
ncbi:hypothetical protein ACLVWU_17025 [Bdellovibrio sp. HCB290]|uniref:hypothetical protein n=1 Tax=Bdellovibrio sp. HCB290 TaxID=3394356 RepID=UPI0039B6161A